MTRLPALPPPVHVFPRFPRRLIPRRVACALGITVGIALGIGLPHSERAFGASAATPPAGGGAGARVLVLPFQPIFRSVMQPKIQTATDLLLKELKQRDDLSVVRGAVAKTEIEGPTLDAAKEALEAATKAEAERNMAVAIGHRRRAIEEMERNAAALTHSEDYIAAQHYLARALMWAGQDHDAQAVLDGVARMSPSFAVSSTDFSRLYRKWFEAAATRAMQEKPGELLVTSSLPGAVITLDGRTMDVAPVLIRKAAVGRHLLGASIPGVPPFSAVVEIKPGKKTDFQVTFSNIMGGNSLGFIGDAVAQNAIPRKAVEGAIAAGKDAQAAFVVIGAMAKDDDKFKVHTYVVSVETGLIAPLDAVDFDLELLTAESDVLRLVQAISLSVGKFSGGEKAIDAIDRRIKKQNTTNEVDASLVLAQDEADLRQAAGSDAERKARPVFKPLKGGTIKIKDEEE